MAPHPWSKALKTPSGTSRPDRHAATLAATWCGEDPPRMTASPFAASSCEWRTNNRRAASGNVKVAASGVLELGVGVLTAEEL